MGRGSLGSKGVLQIFGGLGFHVMSYTGNNIDGCGSWSWVKGRRGQRGFLQIFGGLGFHVTSYTGNNIDGCGSWVQGHRARAGFVDI